MKFLNFMITLAKCTILNGYTQVDIKILLIQSYQITCVSFSCEFIFNVKLYVARYKATMLWEFRMLFKTGFGSG